MTILRASLLVGGTLAAFVAALAIVGALLPRGHVETRTATLAATPQAVWDAIADVDGYQRWRTSLSAVEVRPPIDGRRQWIEVTGRDRIAMEQVATEAPHRLVTRIADPNLPFGGTWTFELAAAGPGTRVTITERGEIRNPLFRAIARFVFGYGGTMETFLEELRARLG